MHCSSRPKHVTWIILGYCLSWSIKANIVALWDYPVLFGSIQVINPDSALALSNSITKRMWCIFFSFYTEIRKVLKLKSTQFSSESTFAMTGMIAFVYLIPYRGLQPQQPFRIHVFDLKLFCDGGIKFNFTLIMHVNNWIVSDFWQINLFLFSKHVIIMCLVDSEKYTCCPGQ